MSKHGMSGTPEHQAWADMRNRCNNPDYYQYAVYGGRGITVCAEWDSFVKFYTDMGPRTAGLSLDRIDNDGDYSASNCRWATLRQQANNTSLNVRHAGKTIAQWAEQKGVDANTIRNRIHRGWDIERAINTPIRHRRK